MLDLLLMPPQQRSRLAELAAAPVARRGFDVMPEPAIAPGLPAMQAQSAIFGLDPVDDATPRLRGQAPQTVSQTARDWATALDVAGVSGGITRGIHAYHASPHSFDRFDASRMGTGEGVQVIAPGLYFAESPAVSGRGGYYDRKFTAWKGSPANIYEVNLNTSPDHLLDWDAPLRRQPAAVQEFLDANGLRLPQRETGRGIFAEVGARVRAPGQTGPVEISRNAAERFREAGIPGVRYLDAGSRAGDGTRNYVMFDDSLIEILRKYGLAGLGVGLGAGAATQAEAGQ